MAKSQTLSPSARRKIADKLRGIKRSDATRALLSAHMMGNTHAMGCQHPKYQPRGWHGRFICLEKETEK